MITVDRVRKRYGAQTVLDGIDLEVCSGEVVGLVGPNGVGKSTLLRMIIGLVRPDSGQITIDGMRYRDLPRPLTVIGSALAVTTARRKMTPRQHLLALARSQRVAASRVEELLELAGIAGFADRQIRQLSLGLGQRWALAAAMLGSPRHLVLDEPTNGLDPLGLAWFRELVRTASADGCAVLIASHHLDEVSRLCSRVEALTRDGGTIDLDRLASSPPRVRIEADDSVSAQLRPILARLGGQASAVEGDPGVWEIVGLTAEEVSRSAVAHGLVLRRLHERRLGLEDSLLQLSQRRGGDGSLRARGQA